MWQQRPSELLKICDPYVAYCLDEAAAELISHKDRPKYPEDKPAAGNSDPTKNPELMQQLAAKGFLKINKPEAAV